MVDPVTGTTGAGVAGAGKSTMGKDDFLKLMIEQLKNQDPLNPMDGSEYAAQLAQFSSLEQLSNLNSAVQESMNANYQLTQSINNSLMAAMVGKEVKVAGQVIQAAGQDSVSLGYTLPADAKSVTVKIYDQYGQLVRTIENLPGQSGDSKLSWDLSDNDGNKVTDGYYSFDVEAVDYQGQAMTVDMFKTGIIDGVKFSKDGTYLMIGGAQYSISDVTEILNSKTGG